LSTAYCSDKIYRGSNHKSDEKFFGKQWRKIGSIAQFFHIAQMCTLVFIGREFKLSASARGLKYISIKLRKIGSTACAVTVHVGLYRTNFEMGFRMKRTIPQMFGSQNGVFVWLNEETECGNHNDALFTVACGRRFARLVITWHYVRPIVR
jgi:hypothetical protein